MPDAERYADFEATDATENDTSTWVVATTERDLDRMMSLIELFPPYMFDSNSYVRPGSGGPRLGYIVMVDRGELVFVVTEDRAKDVTVSIAYVPSFRDPVVFAIGVMTELGVKVMMAD